MDLPTRKQMFARAQRAMDDAERLLCDGALDRAYRRFSDAADWLRSVWVPVGSSLSSAQARRRVAMRERITEARSEIEQRTSAAA